MEKDLHVQRRLPHPSSRATWTGDRYELPRAKLLGGDPLRGGNPCAPGHAGRSSIKLAQSSSTHVATHVDTRSRRTARAVAATIIVLVAQVLGLFACISTPAVAATGNDPMTVTYDGGNEVSRHALDGNEAYCANSYRWSPPVGTVLTSWHSGPLALDYVLYHSDGGAPDADPHYEWYIAKWVVWAIMEGKPSELDYYANGSPNPTAPTNHKLYDEAMAFQASGGNGPERGCSRVYDPPHEVYQPIVVYAPTLGDLQLSKASSLPAISLDDACYSLEGAEYTVYSDEGCSTPVATMITDSSGAAKSISVAQDTYWVKETKAPSGFAPNDTTYEVQVVASQTTVVGGEEVTDEPLFARIGSLVRKGDVELLTRGETGTGQGDATLAGALFQVERYANQTGDTSGEPVRSWIIETDGSGQAFLDDGHLVEGDEPYRDAEGNVVLPLGTYLLREIEAPAGYLLSDGPICMFVVEQDGDGVMARVVEGPTPSETHADEALFLIPEQVVRGGVRVGKVDAQRGDSTPQGSATLEGAIIAIELAQGQPVVVDGNTYSAGQVVTTLTIGSDGAAQTDTNTLPFGSYIAYEVEAPVGYLITSRGTWNVPFQIIEEGVIVDLSDVESSVPNLVKRGDLEFIKVDGQSMSRMPGVPFVVESLTTGERHVMVTDENGYCSTDASFIAHSYRTNANDVALSEDGVLDEQALDPTAGVWFSGGVDRELAPNDSLGALPYDTYRVSELRASTNDGYELVSFDVIVTRDQHIVDGGTLDDQPLPTIQTTLAIAGSYAESDMWELSDIVQYGNVATGGTEYTVHGTLHLIGGDGSDQGVVAESQASFVPAGTSGTVEVPFEVDVSTLRGHTLVAFEELWCDGELVAEHADVTDSGQSVSIPSISTTLTDETGAKEVDGSSAVTLVDEVRYEGLVTGKAYQLSGTLVDRATGEAIIGADGMPITAGSTFIAETEQGVAWVSFTFDGSACRGKSVVAFESLSREGVKLAVHADINDEAQIVTVPRISTSASDDADGNHELLASERACIKDVIAYEGLIAGETYTVSGVLMDRVTGEELSTEEGLVTSEATFSPECTEGTVTVSFALDASTLGGRELVVFETLLHDGKVVARHDDLSSDEQSIRIPSMGTIAASSSGGKTIPAEPKQTIVDVISYKGLTPGRSYVASGTLHLRGSDGSDQGPLTDERGNLVTASTSFTPEQPSGTVEVTFSLDASKLGGKTLVAFETLSTEDDGTFVALHEDISDGGQSVQIEELPEVPVNPPTTTAKLPKTGDLLMPLKGMCISACFALGLGAWMRTKEPRD